jgi:hypothetical protein
MEKQPARGALFLNEELKMKKEITSSGSARAARGGSTRPDERKRKQGKA